MTRFNKFFKVSLVSAMLGCWGCMLPLLTYGRVNERAIIWSSSVGHTHDGGTKGKKVNSDDVIYDNFGSSLSAIHMEGAIDELDEDVVTHIASPSVHHIKTTSFTDLADSATDAQIPNTITINNAINADTVDSQHFTDIQADTASKVSTHAGNADVHHIKTTSFTDLVDSAIDAQIPNDITITFASASNTSNTALAANTAATATYATSSGSASTATSADNADTVDNQHFTDIQADAASQITTHTGGANAHHSSTSDGLSLTPSLVHLENASAGTTVLEFFVTGDSVNRLAFKPDGKIYAGGGAGAIDCALYRESADLWTTGVGDNFRIKGGILNLDTDTTIYRGGANLLQTDDTFQAALINQEGADVGTTVLQLNVTGDTQNRLAFKADGTIFAGSGAGAVDVSLLRESANLWSTGTGDNLRVKGGTIYFDSDVILYKGAADTLVTDDTFVAPTFTSSNSAYNITHAATTRYFSTHATAFETLNAGVADSEQWGTPARIRSSGTGFYCYAQTDCQLTHGSTITQFLARGATNSGVTNEVIVSLKRVDSSNNATVMGTCSFSDSSTNCTDNTISNPVIDVANYSYMFEVKTFASSTLADAAFFVVEGQYTTTNLGQVQ